MSPRFARVAAVSLSALLSGCDVGLFGDCDDTVVSEALRPDGPHRAVVYVRNCGATTAYATHVALHERGRFFDSESAIVFVGASGEPSRPRVSARWVDRNKLEVTYPRTTRVSRTLTSWEGIDIVLIPAR
jgi:hypothetical protein